MNHIVSFDPYGTALQRFDPEYECGFSFRNVSVHLPDYKASYSINVYWVTYKQDWKLQTSQRKVFKNQTFEEDQLIMHRPKRFACCV